MGFKLHYNYIIETLHNTQYNRYNGGYQSGHHKRMVQQIFAYSCCSGSIKVYGGYHCRIVGQEKVTVHSWENAR